MPGKAEMQSEEEYRNDPNFQAIDQKIRNENDLSQYNVVSVSKQIVNRHIYIITYRGPDGREKIYEVFVNSNGEIQVQKEE